MIRIVIADDQELIRESLKIILSTHKDVEIVGVAADGFEVLDILKHNEVDIILMDIRMPRMDGVYCTKIVKEQYPNTKVVILTTFNDDDFVFSALKYGASGYLLKDVSMDELYSDIVTVYKGGALINPDIATKVFSMFTKMSQRNMIIQVDETFLKDISKTFHAGTVNEKTALDGLSLHLNEGDFVTVIGGNGAGKSTMLNAVAGVWPVDEGTIEIDGVNVTKFPEYKRASYLGRVFQDPMNGTAATMQITEAIRVGHRARHTRCMIFWVVSVLVIWGAAVTISLLLSITSYLHSS